MLKPAVDDLNIAVVAHDAGAANHIKSWVQTGYIDAGKVNLYVTGPAEKIFSNIVTKAKCNNLTDTLFGVSLLISGTGVPTSFEHDARVLASKNKIKTVAVIDHWTNYNARFSRAGCEVLPDEIWVVDEYALVLAKIAFPTLNIYLHRNDYIELQVQEINLCRKHESSQNVLFLMEPVPEKWCGSDLPGEIQALDYLVSNLNKLGLGEDIVIAIKPHPADQIGKYNYLLARYKHLQLHIEDNLTLSQLIAWADLVVGCQTYALVVAAKAGKKVISSIPPCGPKCVLPQKEIIHLSSVCAA